MSSDENGIESPARPELTPEEHGWEYAVALLPLHVTEVVRLGRPILMAYANARERRLFYEAALAQPWLPPPVRNAILKELGRKPKEEAARVAEARSATLMVVVAEAEDRVRASGRRRGAHKLALEEVAANAGMDVEALDKRLKRYKRRLRSISGVSRTSDDSAR
jgi:hypothetical protein